MNNSSIIQLKNIHKSYETRFQSVPVLHDINVNFIAGQSVALLGASGSGKSTLMNILGLLDLPSSGQYFLKGVDVAQKSMGECAQIRNQVIGFVFQRFNLLPYLTACENVALPLSYRGVSRRVRMEKAAHILERLGLHDRLGHFPAELSGGQCQRVAIARALVTDPDIILADEPTGNLDSVSGGQALEIFVGLAKQGKTLITVTHDHNVARHMERVITVKDGRLLG